MQNNNTFGNRMFVFMWKCEEASTDCPPHPHTSGREHTIPKPFFSNYGPTGLCRNLIILSATNSRVLILVNLNLWEISDLPSSPIFIPLYQLFMTGSDKLEPHHMPGKSASPHSPPTVQFTLISLKLSFIKKFWLTAVGMVHYKLTTLSRVIWQLINSEYWE
jgi:hypothetical protein